MEHKSFNTLNIWKRVGLDKVDIQIRKPKIWEAAGLLAVSEISLVIAFFSLSEGNNRLEYSDFNRSISDASLTEKQAWFLAMTILLISVEATGLAIAAKTVQMNESFGKIIKGEA